MTSFVPINPCKKIKPFKPATGIRKWILDKAERLTQATDAKPHKGLFNSRSGKIRSKKHAKHQSKYRINVPSDAMIHNTRHYTRGLGLARFE